MNAETFHKLWYAGRPPGQQKVEWFYFMGFASNYLQPIENPVVVEIGIRRGGQKRFWNELGATHLGIDISDKYGDPDIIGNSHDPVIKRKLQSRLDYLCHSANGDGKCDLLFIDGDHSYEGVKKDFERYSPLCSGIVAIHDVRCIRKDVDVYSFWDDLNIDAMESEDPKTFIEFFHPQPPDHYGIGVIL